jgi:hypothetical protein
MRIVAYVEEQEKPVFVTTMSPQEANKLGDEGVERMVRDWCEKRNPPLTFVDYGC